MILLKWSKLKKDGSHELIYTVDFEKWAKCCMGDEEKSALDLESSRLAAKREYDEPFVVLEQEKRDIDTLRCAAQRRGLTITTGGQCYHLHGQTDKGEACCD
jgi:predicted mannosyl-3-phosphoglycerate phosphatase (HAD superfamily)